MTVTYTFASRREWSASAPSRPELHDLAPEAAEAEEAVDLRAPDGVEDLERPPATPEGEDQGLLAEGLASTLAAGSVPNLPAKWRPQSSRLILVAKARGGVGATSIAINLAIELQKKPRLLRSSLPRRVALVDFDVQFGNAASLLDLEDRGGMLDLLRLAAEPDAQAVRNVLLTHSSGLKVLPAPRSAIPLEALDAVRTESIIAALMAEHDYVVVDLPPALVPWLEPLLRRASQLLIVSDLAVPSIACARRVLDLMREDNPGLSVETVLSREQKPVFQRRIHRQAAEALGLPLTHWLPDEPKLSRLALDRGEPMATLAPRCAWSKAVRQIALSLDARLGAEAKS